MISINYSNLYNTSSFKPSYVKTEEAMPNRRNSFGEVRRLQGLKTIDNVTNQNYMKSLGTTVLTNRPNMRDMKNKTLYSLDSNIKAHSALNIL